MKINQKIYNYSVVVLALISIALVIFDFSNVINISDPPFNIIDNFILITFTIDYVLIVISAMIYSYAENVPYIDAFWWALVTTTTVGYGDISPATPLGRVAAIILMILGIGFIGMLTSTITEYFNKSNNEDEESNDKIEILINKIDQLETTIEQLKEEIKK